MRKQKYKIPGRKQWLHTYVELEHKEYRIMGIAEPMKRAGLIIIFAAAFVVVPCRGGGQNETAKSADLASSVPVVDTTATTTKYYNFRCSDSSCESSIRYCK